MKTFGYICAILLCIGAIGLAICKSCDGGNEPTATTGNTTVENFIKTDKAYFANMAGKNMFFESQVVLDKPFNEGDKFVAVDVNNVFEQILPYKDTEECKVYQFKRIINYGETQMTVVNGHWCEDVVINLDSLKLTFEDAYNRAKQSDLIPSKSHFMVLRTPLGSQKCNPQYIIGNDNYGIMFVDAITGDVTNKNPAFPNK